MRIVRFRAPAVPDGAYGLVEGDRVQVLAGDPLAGVQRTGLALPLGAVTQYLPPVEPPNIIAIGRNYIEHVRESDSTLPAHPVIFIKTTNTLAAHRQPILLPREAPREVDFEVELGVVIRDRVKRVAEEEALRHVWGYTIAQDISARDCQLRLDQQWARGKSFDTFCPIGPWIETELDPGRVTVRTRLNGACLQEASTADMLFPVAFLISYLSRMMTLRPGTLILTGTPSGVGFARRPPVFLQAGDLLVSEIEGIGRMENPVAMES